MLVKIKRNDYESLDDTSLIWACIEPTIKQIRGKSFSVKFEASTHLNSGQMALLMFQMFYGHSGNGITELLTHLSYLLSRKGVWAELKNGFRYFGNTEMLPLLGELEALFFKLKQNNGLSDSEWLDISSIEMDQELTLKLNQLEKSIFEIMPLMIIRVASHIRSNSDEFLQIEE